MHFCVHCGAPLERIFSTLCFQCNNNDELSGPYCIMCGATCEQIFHSKSEVVPAAGVQEKLGDRVPKIETFSIPPLSGILYRKEMILAALCFGVTLGYTFVFLSKLSGGVGNIKIADKRPTSGLTIYTKQPYATIAIENEQHRLLLSTKLNAEGSLTLKTLPSGHYILKITAPSHQSISEKVTIVEGNPTVLDLPKLFDLTHTVSSPPAPQKPSNQINY